MGWILNNLHNKERCNYILIGYSESWRYVQAHLAAVCRRRLLLDLFDDSEIIFNLMVKYRCIALVTHIPIISIHIFWERTQNYPSVKTSRGAWPRAVGPSADTN